MISKGDKQSIISFIKILYARTKAGEENVCVKCYIQKVLEILDKYDNIHHNNSKSGV